MLLFLLAAWIGLGEIFWFHQKPLLNEYQSHSLSPTDILQQESTKTNTVFKSINRRLAYWIYPTVELNTEHYVKLFCMLRLPVFKKHHVWWIDPGLQKLGPPLIDSDSVGRSANFVRYSMGSGYRRFCASAWLLGGYCYYDYDQYGFISEVHTINIGIENHFTKWHTVGNIYFSFPRSLSRTSYTKCGVDYKIEKIFSCFKIGFGAYRKQMQATNMNSDIADAQSDSLHAWLTYGGVLTFQYIDNFRIYNAKYAYDNLGKHRVSFGIQWNFLEPFKGKIATKLEGRLWHPVERYLAASTLNYAEYERRSEKIGVVDTHHENVRKKIDETQDAFCKQFVVNGLSQKKAASFPPLNPTAHSRSAVVLRAMGVLGVTEGSDLVAEDINLLRNYNKEIGRLWISTLGLRPWDHLCKKLEKEKNQSLALLISENNTHQWTPQAIVTLLRGLHIPRHAVFQNTKINSFSAEQRRTLSGRPFFDYQLDEVIDQLTVMQNEMPWLLNKQQKNTLSVMQNRKACGHSPWGYADIKKFSDQEEWMFLMLRQIECLYRTPLIIREKLTSNEMGALIAMGEVSEDVRRFERAAEILTRCDPLLKKQLLLFFNFKESKIVDLSSKEIPREILDHIITYLIRMHLVDHALNSAILRSYTRVHSYAFYHIPEHYQNVEQLEQSVVVVLDYLFSLRTRRRAVRFMESIPYDLPYYQGLF